MGMIFNIINDISIWISNFIFLGLNFIYSKIKMELILIKGVFLKYCRVLKERYV